MEEAPKDPATAAAAAEEEATKKNTDCVYFLASPFTCKKGSECEYRHSDTARMNPRDCWYWLNSNCLNPMCSYRHPPLEAFLGSRGTTVTGVPPMASSQPAASLPAPVLAPAQGRAVGGAPQVPSKQSVPCYYFQQGYCKKADRCPFLHGPQPANVLAPAPPAQPSKTFDESAQPRLKIAAPLQKFASQDVLLQTNIPWMSKAETEPIRRPEWKSSTSLELIQDHQVASPRPINDLAFKRNHGSYMSSHVSSAEDEPHTNGLEAGEILRESSPGFDVLVDTEDAEFYVDGEEFSHNLDDGGRHLSSVGEYQYHHSLNFDGVTEYEKEPYSAHAAGAVDHDRLDWEYNGRRSSLRRSSERSSLRRSSERSSLRGSSDRSSLRRSSERSSLRRSSERSSTLENRGLRRPRSPERIRGSDLRHQLSKQRRIEGVPRSDHGTNYERKRQLAVDCGFDNCSRKGQQSLSQKSNISSRLLGRLKLPAEAYNERGMNLRRMPPIQPNKVEQGRLLSSRIRQSSDLAGRNKRNSISRRDEVNNTVDFAAPKSLAELKGARDSVRSEGPTSKSNDRTAGVRSAKTLERSGADGDISFEGPKPFTEILTRKRENVSFSGTDSDTGDANNQVGSKGKQVSGENMALAAFTSSEGDQVSGDRAISIPDKGTPLSSDQEFAKVNDIEAGDDRAGEEDFEDGYENDYYEEGDEEYEYEETETGKGELEEYENMDVENAFLDDDDEEEDFATKIEATSH